jgi:hypothetical protein
VLILALDLATNTGPDGAEQQCQFCKRLYQTGGTLTGSGTVTVTGAGSLWSGYKMAILIANQAG